MFQTNRCCISTIQKCDYVDVKKLYQNQEVRKYLGGIRDEGSIGVVIEEMLHSNEPSYYWVVKEQVTREFMGLVSLDQHHNRVDFEVSYQILPKYWGNGFATEVVQFMIDYAFNELKLTRVIAETQTANNSSCRLLERVGMKLEKIVTRFGAEQAIFSIEV
ncbi:GNAT family N-acetyltransferase [Anaerobacillus sp. CMMVII]|nr:GNAT family N-acetyltransferase [Anaerobacillus sp. CMMVII]